MDRRTVEFILHCMEPLLIGAFFLIQIYGLQQGFKWWWSGEIPFSDLWHLIKFFLAMNLGAFAAMKILKALKGK